MNAPVDISRIKPGDEVLVRCVAAPGFCPQRPLVTPDSGALVGNEFMPPSKAIVSHTPKALSVGDVVRAAPHVSTWKDKPHSGVIRAIDGDAAWLRWDHLEREPYSTDNIWPLSDLERAQ
jgi:hypothetical protein